MDTRSAEQDANVATVMRVIATRYDQGMFPKLSARLREGVLHESKRQKLSRLMIGDDLKGDLRMYVFPSATVADYQEAVRIFTEVTGATPMIQETLWKAENLPTNLAAAVDGR